MSLSGGPGQYQAENGRPGGGKSTPFSSSPFDLTRAALVYGTGGSQAG